jgi:hypothetical protein
MALKNRIGPLAAALAAAGGIAGAAGNAKAVDCDTLTTFPNHVYGAGGSAITATLQALAPVLQTLPNAADQITIFYSDTDACTGYQAFLDNNETATFKYWDPATPATTLTCTAGGTGHPVDFSTMANFPSLCSKALPAGVQDQQGPAQGLNILVPHGSQQTVISAEALAKIYGAGAATASTVTPWTNPTYIFTRPPTSFATLFLAKAIGVAATTVGSAGASTLTNSESTNGAVVTALSSGALSTDTTAENSGLGFASGPTADAAPTKVTTLAYQHVGQTTGYLPDSQPGVLDKWNIRTGQYELWSYNQFYSRTGAQDNATVDRLFGYILGTVAPPTGVNITQTLIKSGQIPECAMLVQRDGDLGALSSYCSPDPCGCYFDSIAPGSTTTCTACGDSTPCTGAGQTCRLGFCEAY